MQCAGLQGVYDLGYAETGAVLGTPYQQYRANGADNPTASGNLIGTLSAWLTTDKGLTGTAQPQPGKPGWYGAFTRATVQNGDYLIGQNGTFFVSSLIYPAPVQLVWCNRILTVTRMQDGIVAGRNPNYGGNVSADAEPVISGWPGSLLNAGTRGSSNAMQLPNDSKMGVTTIMLPASVPVPIYANDLVADDLGNGFAIASAELTPLGWRINADLWKQG